ncbi:MAG: hypothetical protein A3G70_07200 [Planctomycetes bacterium RIFCSPLOWO2_12_FULL_39_13]|nr:MAG: hypothetical protein A3G70_07200 [Planctomycetes bacterium RIFCSPLOWO2_12_FULL_39_13]
MSNGCGYFLCFIQCNGCPSGWLQKGLRNGRCEKIFYAFLLVFGLITVASQPLHADYLDTWNWRNPLPQGNTLLSVAYGNSIFVAVGKHETVLTSPNGKTWQTRSSGTTESLEGVIYSNSIFVAVGESGTIITSSDGVTWMTRTSGTNKALNGVAYGNSTFVAVGVIETILQSGSSETPLGY